MTSGQPLHSLTAAELERAYRWVDVQREVIDRASATSPTGQVAAVLAAVVDVFQASLYRQLCEAYDREATVSPPRGHKPNDYPPSLVARVGG
jgi:hypothetical protein